METISTFSQLFFEWLLRSTLQASIIVCLILLIQAAVRNRLTARWHYALWLILVVRMILPWAPQSRFSIYNLAARQNKAAAPTHVMMEQDVESPTVSRQPAETQQTAVGSKPTGTAEKQSRILPDQVGTSGGYPDSAARAGFTVVSVLPFIWLGGMLFLGGYIVISNLRLWRAASVEHPATDKDTLELLEECRTAIGLRTIVALIPSDAVNTPILLGFVRPRLLVPKNISKKLTREELRYIFLHELAHVKRHDIALGWLTALLQILHWFNPLIWLAFHRMRSNRESACDVLVLSRTQGEAARNYGLAIVSLLEHFSVPQALPGLAGILESKSQLKRRIAMITQFDNKSYRWSPLAAVLIIILACISLPDATRTKASGASVSGPPMTIRQVWKDPQLFGFGAISPCGRYFAFRDKETGDLSIRELATGTNRRLTNKGQLNEGGSKGVIDSPVFSPDSSRIAYAWVEKDEGPDLRVIGLDTSAPRILLKERGTSVLPIAWSPDGNTLLVNLYKFKSPMDSHYALVDVSDGSNRILESLTRDMGVGAGFSPNGKYILYNSPQEKDSPESDIFLLAVDTGVHSPLVRHLANDKALAWTPDGSSVLFASDRSGTQDAWLIQVADGRPAGEPRLIKSDLGRAYGLGFAQNGSFYYSVWSQPSDIYVATLDPQTGKVVGPPKKVSLYMEGSCRTPDWSPDGRYLAYISQEWGENPKIVIVTLKTGECHELSISLERIFFGGARWSPDGRSFILAGGKGTNVSVESIGIYKVDAQTGEKSLVKQAPRPGSPEWTPDGKGIVYGQGGGVAGPYRIMLHDLETGQERELASTNAADAGAFALSPDGRQLALTVREEEPRCLAIKLLPMAGGQPRELTRVMPPDTIGALEWMPDGRHLLFKKLRDRKNNNPASGSTTLWCVSVEGGTDPQQVDLKDLPGTGLGYPRMHPDGRRIALTLHSPNTGELWVMENFLPTTAVAESGK